MKHKLGLHFFPRRSISERLRLTVSQERARASVSNASFSFFYRLPPIIPLFWKATGQCLQHGTSRIRMTHKCSNAKLPPVLGIEDKAACTQMVGRVQDEHLTWVGSGPQHSTASSQSKVMTADLQVGRTLENQLIPFAVLLLCNVR